MPPDVLDFLKGLSNLSLSSIVFIIWYFDQKKIGKWQRMAEDQRDDKKIMREEREQLVGLLEKHATLIERCVNLLDRLERRSGV